MKTVILKFLEAVETKGRQEREIKRFVLGFLLGIGWKTMGKGDVAFLHAKGRLMRIPGLKYRLSAFFPGEKGLKEDNRAFSRQVKSYFHDFRKRLLIVLFLSLLGFIPVIFLCLNQSFFLLFDSFNSCFLLFLHVSTFFFSSKEDLSSLLIFITSLSFLYLFFAL